MMCCGIKEKDNNRDRFFVLKPGAAQHNSITSNTKYDYIFLLETTSYDDTTALKKYKVKQGTHEKTNKHTLSFR